MLRRKTKTSRKVHEEKQHPEKRKKHVLNVKIRPERKIAAKHAPSPGPVDLRTRKDSQKNEKTDAQSRESSGNYLPSNAYDEKIEKHKRLVMWSGVGFFMLLILFVWTMNVKTIIKAGSKEIQAKSAASNSLTDALDESLGDIKESINDLKEVSGKMKDMKDYSGSVTTTLGNLSDFASTTSPVEKDSAIKPSDELDKKLDILEKNIESMTGSSTSR
jgi:hypothetical protein